MAYSKYIVVLVTAPSQKNARIMAEALVKERLAACVNLISGVNSVFRWKGSVERTQEVILLIKTQKALFSRVEDAVNKLNPYELPEVLALPIEKGKAAYLRWIKDATSIASSV